ncbi:hypothetical protein PTE30175_02255 [Pandoraea terrae]|uniref:Uncharacterized protein n=1 Tax=Pandoraea terrae TaxID=1537710 RepID=A0A5E4UZU5_9BURK|nr:hypothetical protein PTE30175_02255 [Pandoraea terrae]
MVALACVGIFAKFAEHVTSRCRRWNGKYVCFQLGSQLSQQSASIDPVIDNRIDSLHKAG